MVFVTIAIGIPMIDSLVLLHVLVRAAKGSKRCYTPRDCWKDNPKYVYALGLNGTDATENRIRGCYRDTLVYSKPDSPFRWFHTR